MAFALTGVVQSRRGAFAIKVSSQPFSFVPPPCLSSLTIETSSSFFFFYWEQVLCLFSFVKDALNIVWMLELAKKEGLRFRPSSS